MGKIEINDDIRWYIDVYLGGYDNFINKSADEQATIYEQAKEGARDVEGRKQYGPKWKELYESAGKPLPVMQEADDAAGMAVRDRRRDFTKLPAMGFPQDRGERVTINKGGTNEYHTYSPVPVFTNKPPTWEREYPAEGAPAEEMKQYQEDFKKHQAALPRVYGSDLSDRGVYQSNYEAAKLAGATGSELVDAVFIPDYAPPESRKLHSAARKAWNRDFDEAARRERAASDKKHQA